MDDIYRYEREIAKSFVPITKRHEIIFKKCRLLCIIGQDCPCASKLDCQIFKEIANVERKKK